MEVYCWLLGGFLEGMPKAEPDVYTLSERWGQSYKLLGFNAILIYEDSRN
ncbi:hypothetical protein HMPREF9999_00374 [Alloprevotella sp. oral taxon 473 str. F0040]|nr:hypothetical protein HMPREF9999_00374 [Alloprevotella sp. oral taxon 473 str. F0040]